uniref:DUF1294 domain-containing protein n=1 Tax=Crenothrix polyspora TaxID=360316 RepID=UPI0011781494
MLKILLMTLVLFNSASAAEIFKCVDKHGKVSYTDHFCQKTATREVFKPKLGVFKQEEEKVITLHTPPKSHPSQYTTFLYQDYSYQLVIAVYALMSVLCYFCYFIDKRAAEKDLWRIPEKSLHTLELLGG